MFSSLQIYNDLLEKPFLDASEKFYQSEGNVKSRELEVTIILYYSNISRVQIISSILKIELMRNLIELFII
jgi:hypothetical protein